jgi:ureidoglycolate lyase
MGQIKVKSINSIPLNHTNFERFGDFLTLEDANHFKINGGSTDRFHALSQVDTSTQDGKTIISMFRGQAFNLPFVLKVMERHPLGSQTFIPLNPSLGQRYLIVVAPAECVSEEDITNNLSAFIAQGFEGVTYKKGVWHHPLISLDQINDFIVVDRSGPGNNCDEIPISSSVVIDN